MTRWGHAATYIPSPPTLLIQGGKTDESSSFTYSSSPNSADLISLSLSSSFSTSFPPFIPLTSSGPPYAWHTLSLLGQTEGLYSVLSFGGDGGSTKAIQTLSDSAWLADVNPISNSTQFSQQASGWGGQPMRSIWHSAASDSKGGKVYITGGLKDDGSGGAFADVYAFDPSTKEFSGLPSLPQATYHHSSVLLPNGTIVVICGVYTSAETGNPALQPLTSLYSIDTTSAASNWTTVALEGIIPTSRRGSTLVSSDDGSKVFLFGGADTFLSSVYGDSWALDLESRTWNQISQNGAGELVSNNRRVRGTHLLGPAGRFDHSAVAVGNGQIIIFGGESPFDPRTRS
jgi:hypothetical protein